ncbi:hypothetical protein BIW11_12082, partial [Tropilaelaps mercedesae]
TYVNGTRIPEQSYVKLEHGDQIRFGYHQQAFEMQLTRGNDEEHARTPIAAAAAAAAAAGGAVTSPLDDDDSLNESITPVVTNSLTHEQQHQHLLPQQRQTSPMKGGDSLEDVSVGIVPRPTLQRGELHKNHSVPVLEMPTSPLSECLPGGMTRRNVPRDLPLAGMVASYHAAPVRSPSEPQIDNRMVASSLWDQEVKRSPPWADRERPAALSAGGVGVRRAPVAMTIPADRDSPATSPGNRPGLNNNNNIINNNNNNAILPSNGILHVGDLPIGAATGGSVTNNGVAVSPTCPPDGLKPAPLSRCSSTVAIDRSSWAFVVGKATEPYRASNSWRSSVNGEFTGVVRPVNDSDAGEIRRGLSGATFRRGFRK